MNPKMSFQERAKLAAEIISKQPPVTFEEKREQAARLKKESEIRFAQEAPEIQEHLKEITTPLSDEYARAIFRWLARKQITMEMIPKDVLVDFKKNNLYANNKHA